jgi:hypothetical protein
VGQDSDPASATAGLETCPTVRRSMQGDDLVRLHGLGHGQFLLDRHAVAECQFTGSPT